MKVRHRSHPISPQKSPPSSNVDGWRMRRAGTPLYNHYGEDISPPPKPKKEEAPA